MPEEQDGGTHFARSSHTSSAWDAFPSPRLLDEVPSGNEKCDNCLYYLEPTADISYCWHLKLRILVGAEWWCQWWEKIED